MRGLLRRLLFAVAFFGVLLVAHPASALGRVDLEKARAAYQAKNYAEAEQRLNELVDAKSGLKDPALLSSARMYLAAVWLETAKRDAAIDIIKELLNDDPSFEPDPLAFPSNIINTFFEVRAQYQEKLRQDQITRAHREAEARERAEEERRKQEAWLAKVKQMASEEKITVRHNRLVAFLPFGAGQFQNGNQVLGWTFLVTEAACVVGTAITVPMYAYSRGRAEDEARSGDIDRKAQLYQDRADNIRTVNLSFAGAFTALAIAGIVQANLAYVPEAVETKKRELPVVSSVKPVLSPGFVGLSGTFF
jgi:hypothetical protein